MEFVRLMSLTILLAALSQQESQLPQPKTLASGNGPEKVKEEKQKETKQLRPKIFTLDAAKAKAQGKGNVPTEVKGEEMQDVDDLELRLKAVVQKSLKQQEIKPPQPKTTHKELTRKIATQNVVPIGNGPLEEKKEDSRGLDDLEPRLQEIIQQSTKRKVEYVIVTEPNCGCKKKIAVSPEKSSEQSLCSDIATKRGPGQRVNAISFWGSFFKNANRAHRGLAANVWTIPEYYPGWIFRLYTDITPEKQPEDFKVLCNMTCSNNNMDLCLMPYIPVLGDSTDVVAQFWRFFPMMDPLVDVFVSRDADSKASNREAAAVYDWLDLNKTFHVMRDHPGHIGHKILAGMWGGDNRYQRKNMETWGNDLMRSAKGLPAKPPKVFDQEQLDKILWPHIYKDVVAHDAYGCLKNTGTRHWPTQRNTEGWNFVGAHETINHISWKQCPEECRHPDHKDDWINC